MDFKELQDHAVKAAYAAGDVIKQSMDIESQPDFDRKKSTDFVTSIDREAEALILDILKSRYLDIPVLAEESGSTGQPHTYRWIIDPLDGTTNFIHGYPWVAVSIALERCQDHKPFGNPIVGVVLNPFTEDLFTAREGNGAYHNGKRIRMSEVDTIGNALLATGYPFRDREILDEYLRIFKELFKKCHGIRRAGSAALDFAWLAAGAIDGFWEYGLSPWDMAAGAILIREAGGIVTDFWGGNQWLETGNIAAGTPCVHRDIIKVIEQIKPAAE